MHTVLVALQRWLPYFEHHQLVIFTDNTTVFHGLRRHSARGPAADPLRKITLLAALHDIDIHGRWIPTHQNMLADVLSRRNFNKLANMFPLLAQKPTPETHRSLGIPILAFPASQPATYGGASARTPGEHIDRKSVV